MKKQKLLNQIRLRRSRRTRIKIRGTTEKPRLSVFRSNLYTYVQLIDDEKGRTLVSASTKELKNFKEGKNPKVMLAEKLGELIATKAAKDGIKKAVFDRGVNKYHGRIKAVAEGARQAGLKI